MPIKRMLMAEQWEKFSRNVLPVGCSLVQRQEMRRAFYAGGEALMFRIIAIMDPESATTDHDIQIMQDLDDELKAFARAVVEGSA